MKNFFTCLLIWSFWCCLTSSLNAQQITPQSEVVSPLSEVRLPVERASQPSAPGTLSKVDPFALPSSPPSNVSNSDAESIPLPLNDESPLRANNQDLENDGTSPARRTDEGERETTSRETEDFPNGDELRDVRNDDNKELTPEGDVILPDQRTTQRRRSIPVQSTFEKALQPSFTEGLFNKFSLVSPLVQFGYAQLNADTFAFDPIANASVPKDYTIGPGDEIILHQGLSGVEPIVINVNQEGMLIIPKQRPLSVWNLTLKQVNAKIKKNDKFMQASLGKLRSIQINVIGEAQRPGLHRVPALASVYNVLSLIGGVNKTGSLRRIQWKRGKRVVAEIDLYDYFLRGKSLKNIHMQSGDTLFIPLLKDVIAVVGQVRKSAIFELKREKSLKAVLELAGGLLPTANTERIVVERILPNKGKSLKALNASFDQAAKQMIRSFDTIKVFSIPETHVKNFALVGPFTNQGYFEFKEGLTLKEALQIGGKLTQQSSLQGHIERQVYKNETFPESQFLLFNYQDVMEEQDMHNFLLKEGDILQVYPTQNSVFIQGLVASPGKYSFVPGITLSDILQQAGGMETDAYQERIDIRRKLLNDASELVTNLIKLRPSNPLDMQTPLAPNDLVIVYDNDQRFEAISIQGDVKNPGQYAYFEGMTLRDVFFFARGFSSKAYRGRIDIQRNGAGDSALVVSVSLDDPNALDFLVHPNDSILVYDKDTRMSQIHIDGAIESPGAYSFFENMSLKDALFLAGRLKPDAHRGRIDIRRVVLGTNPVTIGIRLDRPGALETKLFPDDTITIYSQSQKVESVKVEGNVKSPDFFEYFEGMTLEDAIFISRGLDFTAHRGRIDIIRNQMGDETKVIPVMMDLSDALQTALMPNDIVRVYDQSVQFEQIIVNGAVKNPGSFQFFPGMTLEDAFFQAKGFIPSTYRERVTIRRVGLGKGPEALTIFLNDPEVLDTELFPQDTILVYDNNDVSRNITIRGQIERPGVYPFLEGMTVEDALFLAKGLAVNAYRGRMDIKREVPKSEVPELLRIILNDPNSLQTPLKPDDELVIYDRESRLGNITIRGEVRTPDTFPYFSGMTVDDAIFLGSGFQADALQEKVDIERHNEEGKRTLLSISLHSGRSEFLLQASDVVTVHPIDVVVPRNVTILGPIVLKPGQHPFLEGMSIRNLIFSAGGLKNKALSSQVTVKRWLNQNGNLSREDFHLRIDPVSLQTTPEFILEEEDLVILRQLPEYNLSQTVTISGEVPYPGTYEITKGDRISDLIKMAGGYIKGAFLPGATLTRQTLKRKEDAIDQRIQKDSRRSLLKTTLDAPSKLTDTGDSLAAAAAAQASVADEAERRVAESSRIPVENENITSLSQAESLAVVESKEKARIQGSNIGRLIIQLGPLEEFTGSPDDIELLAGDSLSIPQQANSVMVKGETYGEASVLLKSGATAYYYLNVLGGPRELASLEEVYILRADGRVVQSGLDQYALEGGDTVVVPPDLSPEDSAFKDTASVVDIIFKTLTTVALIVALL